MNAHRRLPILYVHHRRELGGAPESLAYLVRALDRGRFEPHVFSPEGPSADLFREAGATVHTGPVAGFTHIWASTYHGLRWLLLLRELARLPVHIRAFRQTLARVSPAIVHVNDSPPVAAAWLAQRAGVPVVWHLRSSLPGDATDARSRRLRGLIRRLAAETVAITDDVATSFGIGSHVLPNAVDLDSFRPGDPQQTRADLGLPPDRRLVSFFGFVYPSKGFRELLEATRALRDEGQEMTVLVVGGGVRDESWFRTPRGRLLQLTGAAHDYARDARELVRRLELEDVVRFVPYRRDVADLYRASDVVAAPSQGPELGRSVIEAAASGVPVVATGSRTGAGVLVPGETGLLTRDRSASAIAEALAELLGDEERRRALGRAARAHAERRFDPSRNARELEHLYLLVLGLEPPAPTDVERADAVPG